MQKDELKSLKSGAIGIRFSNNDYSTTVLKFMKILQDSLKYRDIKFSNIEEKRVYVLEVFNRTIYSIFSLYQENKTSILTRMIEDVYLAKKIKIEDVYLDNEVFEYQEKKNFWDNYEFHYFSDLDSEPDSM